MRCIAADLDAYAGTRYATNAGSGGRTATRTTDIELGGALGVSTDHTIRFFADSSARLATAAASSPNVRMSCTSTATTVFGTSRSGDRTSTYAWTAGGEGSGSGRQTNGSNE